MRRPAAVVALLSAVLLLSACSHSLNAARPAYILTDDGKHIYLDLLSAGSSGIVDKIDLGEGGATPPAGGVAVSAGDYVIVTNTAAYSGATLAVPPKTQVCTMTTGSCTALVPDGGSDTVVRGDNGFAVPVYVGGDLEHGTLSIVSNDQPPRVTRTVHLPTGWVPGPFALNRQLSTIYWLTSQPPPTTGTPPTYQLLQLDAASQQVVHQVSFGAQVPTSLAVGPNGNVYVAITFASEPPKDQSVQPAPGHTIESFTSNLDHTASIPVGPGPGRISIGGANGATLAVTYRDPSVTKVDLISLQTGALHSLDLPSEPGPLSFLSTLSDGSFALVSPASGGAFQVGLIDPGGHGIGWQSYTGNPDSAVGG